MAPIRISRAGMVECPACHTHIYVEEDLEQTVCAFCKVELRVGVQSEGIFAAIRSRMGVTGGALTASLAGLSMAACGNTVQPVYGLPADGVPFDAAGADVEPPDVNATDGGTASAAGSSDAGSSDAGSSGSDAGSGDTGAGDIATDTAKDAGAVALYGLPPQDAGSSKDAGSSNDAGKTDAGGGEDAASEDDVSSGDAAASKDVPMQPLYGAPP